MDVLMSQLVSEAVMRQKIHNVDRNDIEKALNIVADFIKDKKRIIYGGTAINMLLPQEDRFYDEYEIPDYDFFTPRAIQDSVQLSTALRRHYSHVEIRPSMHVGTFKIFVDFNPVADLTQMKPSVYKAMSKTTVESDEGFPILSPLLLKLGIFIELSRPHGDVTRWEKVNKRFQLLQKHYPVSSSLHICNSCSLDDSSDKNNMSKVWQATFGIISSQKCILSGAIITRIYEAIMGSKSVKRAVNKFNRECDAPLEVIHTDAKNCAELIKTHLHIMFPRMKLSIDENNSIGEYIDTYYTIRRGNSVVCVIYQTTACHGFHSVQVGSSPLYVASLETALSFSIPQILTESMYWTTQGLMCLCDRWIQDRSKWEKYSKRKNGFNLLALDCLGYQERKIDIIRKKFEKRQKYLNQKKDNEYYNTFFTVYANQDLSALPISMDDESEK